jgi:hypothetical protein
VNAHMRDFSPDALLTGWIAQLVKESWTYETGIEKASLRYVGPDETITITIQYKREETK